MTLSTKSLSYYPELMLKYAGLHPYFVSKISLFYFYYLNCFFFLFLLALAVLEVVTSLLQNNTFRAIEGLSSVLFVTYTFCRYVMNFKKKNALAELLKQQSNFWKIEGFQGPVREGYNHLMEDALGFIKFYKNYAITLATIFYVQPFIFHELQMKIFVPKGWYYYLNCVYWYMTPPLFVSVYGVTSMFCALCVPVVGQFKLLAYKFRNMHLQEERERKEELKMLVNYHNFLLRYSKKINDYANATLLFEYFITVSVCCILMFMLANDYKIVDKIKYGGFIVSQFLDTAVYCYSAELITEASRDVGSAAYDCPWYKSDNYRINRDLNMVVIRAQKAMTFSGFKMVPINMTTFTKIFKATASFVSYLNTIASK